MHRSEAETAIRCFAQQWVTRSKGDPSFYEFWVWMEANHPRFLQFSSRTSVRFDVEHWFALATKQKKSR